MKKLIILLLITVMALLTGCGGSGTQEEEFSVEGLEPAEQVQAIVEHYVEEEVWHGEITDIQVNKDADDAGKYVCLVWVDWDLENKPENAKGVLQAYADELCYELSDNGNTSQFTIFFNAIQQGGLYKRGYSIIDGQPTPTDEICQF